MATYDHTQKGMIHWLLWSLAVFCAGVVSFGSVGRELVWVLCVATALFVVVSVFFARLRVRDTGDHLEVAFGPAGRPRRLVPYADIETAAAARSALIDGWGIHFIPGRGWTWNIHGFDCVELQLRGGGALRIGTDEPDRLVSFIHSKLPAA